MNTQKEMYAVCFHEFGEPNVLKYGKVQVPFINDDEVLIQVEACGVNRADLLYRQGVIVGKAGLPHIPGTEVAGKITQVGSNVQQFKVGEKVIIYPNFYCGVCHHCKNGDENLCINNIVFGFDTKGGYAEYVKAPAEYLIRLPNQVTSIDAATFTATASTSWHMLKKRVNLEKGETVLIIAGGSGIGVYAIQIAKLLGATVITTVGSEEKRKKAYDLGVDFVIDHTKENWYKEVKKITNGKGVDVVFEHVGKATWNESIKALARKGRLVTCGAFTGSKVELDLWPLFAKEISLIGSFSASYQDYVEVLDLAANGKIKPINHAVLSLMDAQKAHEMLEKRSVFGTLVICPKEGESKSGNTN